MEPAEHRGSPRTGRLLLIASATPGGTREENEESQLWIFQALTELVALVIHN